MNDQVFDVLVRAISPDQFSAQAVYFPELKAEASTETEAVQKVREALSEYLASSKLVKVSLKDENPWLEAFGSAADDPDFEIYREEIRKYRLSMDQEFPERDEPVQSTAEPLSRSKAKRQGAGS